jgi:threonyl-tRNA synthetase
MDKQSTEYLDNLRHSTAHLLAAAVMQLWPHAHRTIGPAIENGFYFDFDMGDTKISEEDFPKIEEVMHKLVSDWKSFERSEKTPDEAKHQYPGNGYKHELIDEFASEGQTLTFYTSGNYTDLCRGGHVMHPNSEIKHFKLLSVAGAYWKGNEKNKMLTRIYGTVFPTKVLLDEHLLRLEEAKQKDHKKLGKDLDLFVFSDIVGKGLPLWTSKGATVRREIERFIVDEEIARGYQHVYTPDIANLALYEKSGHYPYYKDSMYAPITIDDEQYMLRPMTCPHHFELYLSRPHSYKELPVRIAELAKLYRYEQSGELSGLLRVRSFCLADAHIIATKEQAAVEVQNALNLIQYIAGVFGLEPGVHYRYRLSLGDREDSTKYYKDDAAWENAEGVLRNVLSSQDVPFFEAHGEAAFYGPKIDIQMKNVNGKEDTAFTVQYDFVMPGRFKLTYTDESGELVEPVVIHRSSVGAIERVMAFLIEHFAGNFPVWLSPSQVTILPIADRHQEYAKVVAESFKTKQVRVHLDLRSETLGAKIRDAAHERTPYVVVIGDKEIEAHSLSIRARGGSDLGSMTPEAFLEFVLEKIQSKSLQLS